MCEKPDVLVQRSYRMGSIITANSEAMDVTGNMFKVSFSLDNWTPW